MQTERSLWNPFIPGSDLDQPTGHGHPIVVVNTKAYKGIPLQIPQTIAGCQITNCYSLGDTSSNGCCSIAICEFTRVDIRIQYLLTMRWTSKWIAGRLLLAIEGGVKRLLGSAKYALSLHCWCVPMGKWSNLTTKKWLEATNCVLGILIIPLSTIHLS